MNERKFGSARMRRGLTGQAGCGQAFRAGPSLSPAGAIAVASPAAFAVSLDAASCLRRRRARILAHPMITYAGKEQDLRAAVSRGRTTMTLRRPEADEVAHSDLARCESIVAMASIFKERTLILPQRGSCGSRRRLQIQSSL